MKKLSQTGHWSIEMELNEENNQMDIGEDAQVRLSDTGSLSASSVVIYSPGGSSIGGPFTGNEDVDEDGLLTSSKSPSLEKDSLLFALHEIGRTEKMDSEAIESEPLIVPNKPERDEEPENDPTPIPESPEPIHWHRFVPFWFGVSSGA